MLIKVETAGGAYNHRVEIAGAVLAWADAMHSNLDGSGAFFVANPGKSVYEVKAFIEGWLCAKGYRGGAYVHEESTLCEKPKPSSAPLSDEVLCQIDDRATCISRVFNWKFEQAEQFAPGDLPQRELDLIHDLARTFGDCGHFGGSLGEVVASAVRTLLPASLLAADDEI